MSAQTRYKPDTVLAIKSKNRGLCRRARADPGALCAGAEQDEDVTWFTRLLVLSGVLLHT